MTTKKQKALGIEIDPEGQYAVQLTRPVKYGRTWLRPSDTDLILKGKVILNEEVSPHVGQILPVTG